MLLHHATQVDFLMNISPASPDGKGLVGPLIKENEYLRKTQLSLNYVLSGKVWLKSSTWSLGYTSYQKNVDFW